MKNPPLPFGRGEVGALVGGLVVLLVRCFFFFCVLPPRDGGPRRNHGDDARDGEEEGIAEPREKGGCEKPCLLFDNLNRRTGNGSRLFSRPHGYRGLLCARVFVDFLCRASVPRKCVISAPPVAVLSRTANRDDLPQHLLSTAGGCG